MNMEEIRNIYNTTVAERDLRFEKKTAKLYKSIIKQIKKNVEDIDLCQSKIEYEFDSGTHRKLAELVLGKLEEKGFTVETEWHTLADEKLNRITAKISGWASLKIINN